MATRIVLCGADSTGRAAPSTLASDWCSEHKDFECIHEVDAGAVMRDMGITRDDLMASLKTEKKEVFFQLQCRIMEEQNRRELATNGKPFITEGGPGPLARVYNEMGPPGRDRLMSISATRECLQRYCKSLVVVQCPLPLSVVDGGIQQTHDAGKQFAMDMCQLLAHCHVPYVYMDVSNHQDRLRFLKEAVSGTGEISLVKTLHCEQVLPLSIPCIASHRSSHQQKSLQTLVVTPQSVQWSVTRFEPGKTNRMIERYGRDRLMLVDFKDQGVTAELVQKILLSGVWVNGEEYQFLGCSSDGLKNRKCYMLRGSVGDVQNAWDECGSFSAIKSVSKRLKRISLLFSSARPTGVVISPENVIQVPDIEVGMLNFTDGCGSIGSGLAEKAIGGAKLQLQSTHLECTEGKKYCPSVLQIRYDGCKGVVMVEPSLMATQLLIRDSMKKFSSGSKPFLELCLCDHSRPYSYGHLNRQFIMLLSSLGIKDEVFLRKQEEHFQRLERMKEEPRAATEMLLWSNKPDLAASVAKCNNVKEFKNDQLIQKNLSELQSKLISKMDKLNTLIPESRNVFGVCDTHHVLNYGECFFRPTIRGVPTTLHGKVTVTKNPCYMLGDVRVLTCVKDDRTRNLEHLVDCIVFPTTGKRPHPTEIAGSDLDGDQYFVCWDHELIVPTLRKPYDYPTVEASSSAKECTRNDMIIHFSRQKQLNMMGKINYFYLYWAEKEGVDSEKCQQLGMLFSRSVDAAKTGDRVKISNYLRPPKRATCGGSAVDCNSTSSTETQPVWTKMQQAAEKKQRELYNTIVSSHVDHDTSGIVAEDFVWSLLKNKQIGMSEFKLFQFVQRWCAGQQWSDDESARKLCNFSKFINFGKFTIDQQKAAIDSGIPIEVVSNALNKSSLLSPDMMDHFFLRSAHYGWRFYFLCNSTQFNWDSMLRAVQRYSESLLIFKLPDGVTIGLHFLVKLQQGQTELPAASVVSYLFSSHFGYKLRHVLGSRYNLRLDEEVLQLYRGKETATFLWLRREVPSRSKGGGEEMLFHRISVDLTRFKRDTRDKHPKVNKEYLCSVEVFVKSDEATSFDVLELDQPEDLPPEIAQPLDHLEELPIEEEEDETEISQVDMAHCTPEFVLQRSASTGNCTEFLQALQKILAREKNLSVNLDLQKALQTLLVTLATQNSHKILSPETLELLQTIVTPLCQHFQTPLLSLQLLNGLNRLHCPQLVGQAAKLCIDNLQMSQTSEFLAAVTHWELWYSLPKDIAYDLARNSFVLCQTLVNASAVQVEQYTCQVAYTLLIGFLHEASSIQEKVSDHVRDTDSSIMKVKAYPGSDVMKDDVERFSDEIVKEGELWKVQFTRTQDANVSKFTIGTYVAINLMTKPQHSSVLFRQVTLGCIIQVLKHPLHIMVEVKEPVPHCLKRSVSLCKGHWQLKLIGNVTTFKRASKSLCSLADDKKAPTELLPFLLHPDSLYDMVTKLLYSAQARDCDEPTSNPVVSSAAVSSPSAFLPHTDTHSTGSMLNPGQQRAVDAAVKQRLTLINGPPGTGKTHVACAIVKHINSHSTGGTILVTAETNMAVDNLTRQLLRLGVRVVRLGGKGQMAHDVICASLEYQINIKQDEHNHSKHESQFPNLKSAKEILRATEVVATTCAGAGDPLLARCGLTFPFVLIDEATQVTEPVSLIPLVQGCQQLVLIGDPKQLSPTLTQHSELASTLFHRLLKVLPQMFLEEQYRMHPKLLKFPSRTFYDDKLKCSDFVHTRPNLTVPHLNDNRLLFVNVSSNERRVHTSYENAAEAEKVVNVVKHFLSNEVSPHEIAVLTPYTGQVHCIRSILANVTSPVEICSVDSFQGREKDVIVFSTVRSNDKGHLGFIDDPFRINVLLTRAKQYLIGIGCKATLSLGSQIWQKWFEEVTEWDSIVSASKAQEREATKLKRKYHHDHEQRQGHQEQHNRGRGRPDPRMYNRRGYQQQPPFQYTVSQEGAQGGPLSYAMHGNQPLYDQGSSGSQQRETQRSRRGRGGGGEGRGGWRGGGGEEGRGGRGGGWRGGGGERRGGRGGRGGGGERRGRGGGGGRGGGWRGGGRGEERGGLREGGRERRGGERGGGGGEGRG